MGKKTKTLYDPLTATRFALSRRQMRAEAKLVLVELARHGGGQKKTVAELAKALGYEGSGGRGRIEACLKNCMGKGFVQRHRLEEEGKPKFYAYALVENHWGFAGEAPPRRVTPTSPKPQGDGDGDEPKDAKNGVNKPQGDGDGDEPEVQIKGALVRGGKKDA